MKKIFILISFIAITPLFAYAQVKFSPLITIPGITDKVNASFSDYINFLYALSIGVAALLAVIKIIIAGVKYMLSDVITNKAGAKDEIKGALLGLLLIIGAYLILNTVNPQITKGKISFPQIPATAKTTKPSVAATGGAPGGTPQGSNTPSKQLLQSITVPLVTAANATTVGNTVNTYKADCAAAGGALTHPTPTTYGCTAKPPAPVPPTPVAAPAPTTNNLQMGCSSLGGTLNGTSCVFIAKSTDDCTAKGGTVTAFNYRGSTCTVPQGKIPSVPPPAPTTPPVLTIPVPIPPTKNGCPPGTLICPGI